MAKHSSHILELARKGAEHKYQELKAELAQLVKDFPDLARRTGAMASGAASAMIRRGRAAVAGADRDGQPKRARRKLSAKARRAISEAQKKRWAAQKATAAAAAAESTPRKAGRKRA
jgi:hypothetical protein